MAGMVQKVMPFIHTAKEVARPRLAIFLRYAKVGCRVAGRVYGLGMSCLQIACRRALKSLQGH